MSTFDINVRVTVEAPAIVEAINRLCDRTPLPAQAVPSVNPVAPVQTAPQAPVEAPQTAQAQSVVSFPATPQIFPFRPPWRPLRPLPRCLLINPLTLTRSPALVRL